MCMGGTCSGFSGFNVLGLFLRWQLAENGTFTLFTHRDQREMHTGTMAKEVLTATMYSPLLKEMSTAQP